MINVMDRLAILCVQRKSIYSQFAQEERKSHLIDIQIYDEKRDARSFAGGMAVIAHPPCRLWGHLLHTVKIEPFDQVREKELGIFCARAVIDNGGILEQPFDSELFKEMGLPSGGMVNKLGFTLEIAQRMFGHSMIKNTWLFFSKINYTEIEPFKPAIHNLPLKPIYHLSHKQREATPVSLAKWLIRQAIKARLS